LNVLVNVAANGRQIARCLGRRFECVVGPLHDAFLKEQQVTQVLVALMIECQLDVVSSPLMAKLTGDRSTRFTQPLLSIVER
jgi:hypothetical protein